MNTPTSPQPLFELAGGEPGLRAVVTTFYEAVFADIMIGYHFARADKQRLIDKEVELAARMLGARHITYTGRPMVEAHARHRIFGGQFDRRLQLLRQAMEAHHLPEPVQEAWIEHTQAMRALITDDEDSNCSHERAEARAARLGVGPPSEP
ncbi:MAG: group 1 truncated hemoglobin [Myxococcota bacterium]